MSHTLNRITKVGNSIVSVDRFTYGLEHLKIREWGEGAALKIGSFCSIANDLEIFLGGNHRVDWVSTFPFGHIFREDLGGGANIYGHPASKGDVSIGSDVWIGSKVTIMSGISIGHGAVLAANSTITKNVEPYSISGGNPGRHLKFRFDKETIDLLLHLKWWDLDIEDIKKISIELTKPPNKARLMQIIGVYR